MQAHHLKTQISFSQRRRIQVWEALFYSDLSRPENLALLRVISGLLQDRRDLHILDCQAPNEYGKYTKEHKQYMVCLTYSAFAGSRKDKLFTPIFAKRRSLIRNLSVISIPEI